MSIKVNVRPAKEGDSIFELGPEGIIDKGQSVDYTEGHHTVAASNQTPAYQRYIGMAGVQDVFWPNSKIVLVKSMF